jgi:dephospho-CoA kinase
MKQKIKVAITGGIGSGKSTVAKYIAELGHAVFSCDEIYKELYDSPIFQGELMLAFPDCVKNGRVDKGLLSQKVFSDSLALQKLNTLSHPRIMSCLYEKMSKVSEPIAFAEVPLLFEGGLEQDFDYVIVVLRNIERRIAAILERDGVDRTAALARIQKQWDYDLPQNRIRFKEKKFFIIENDADIQCLQQAIERTLSHLIYK